MKTNLFFIFLFIFVSLSCSSIKYKVEKGCMTYEDYSKIKITGKFYYKKTGKTFFKEYLNLLKPDYNLIGFTYKYDSVRIVVKNRDTVFFDKIVNTIKGIGFATGTLVTNKNTIAIEVPKDKITLELDTTQLKKYKYVYIYRDYEILKSFLYIHYFRKYKYWIIYTNKERKFL